MEPARWRERERGEVKREKKKEGCGGAKRVAAAPLKKIIFFQSFVKACIQSVGFHQKRAMSGSSGLSSNEISSVEATERSRALQHEGVVVCVCVGGGEGGEADHGRSATYEKPLRRKNGNSEPQSFDLSRPLFPKQLQRGALREGTGEREGKVAAVRERKQGLRRRGSCSLVLQRRRRKRLERRSSGGKSALLLTCPSGHGKRNTEREDPGEWLLSQTAC